MSPRLPCPECPAVGLSPLARRPTDPRGHRLAACRGCHRLYWRRRARDGRPVLVPIGRRRVSPRRADCGA